MVVPALLFVLAAFPALATAKPPLFESTPLEAQIHATRAQIVEQVRTEGSTLRGYPVQWHAEYATSETLLEEGKGTPAGSGTTPVDNTHLISIGGLVNKENQASGILRHLTPNTTYYARFVVASEAEGEATKTEKFTTTAVAKPEVALGGAGTTREGITTFEAEASGPTAEKLSAQIESNGAETAYGLEVATSKGGPWQPCATGSITVAEDFARPEAQCTALTPETTYYARVKASNEKGEVIQARFIGEHGEQESFTTLTAKPEAFITQVRNVTAASAHLTGSVNPHGSATEWRFESAASESGPWAPVPGAAGTISQAQAETMLYRSAVPVETTLTGLSPSTTYYVRLFAENAAGEAVLCFNRGLEKCEPLSTVTHGFQHFETSGPPSATTLATHALHGESLRILGAVNPNSLPTSEEQQITVEGAPTGGTFALSFEGQATGATASGDLVSGAATGSGDLSAAIGQGHFDKGSTKVIGVNTIAGAFAVGQEIGGQVQVQSGPGLGTNVPGTPPNTTITAVGPGTLTLSAPAEATGESFVLAAGSKQLTGLATSTGAFAVGQHITGEGIPANTTITAVGPGTLTLSRLAFATKATVSLTGVALTANSDLVTNLSTPTGAFVKGESVSGPGIPPGTTVLAQEGDTLTLSANATAAGSGVALTAGIPPDASAETVEKALDALPSKPEVSVSGPAAGPYTAYFGGLNENSPRPGKDQPQIGADASGLSPSGAVTVTTTQQGGAAYDTHYHFEYVSEVQFKTEGEWAKATSTPEVEAGSGDSPKFAGQDLPGLTPGETYRYRVVATNTSPGNPVIDGKEQALTVPPTLEPAPQGPCPNQATRTGPSANLPDCRAYEQITPTDKGGAQEVLKYGGKAGFQGVLPGADGDHLAVLARLVKWGSAPTSGQSPYVFSRDPATGWRMTAATAQPEAGLNDYEAQVLSPDLTQLGFGSSYLTSLQSQSPSVEFKAGPPGGPYASIPVPRSQAGGERGGWVAASADFSKLILQVEDHKLLGPSTGTKSGFDLYEYSSGQLRQANAGIGACGARIAHGREQTNDDAGLTSSPHAVSADGSRVFFEAVPGADCSAAPHLYMRLDGESTVDIGAYRFLAANPEGTKVLLEQGGEALLYEAESATVKPLFSAPASALQQGTVVSEDLTAVYFTSEAQLTPEAPSLSTQLSKETATNLYRYDIPAETLGFLVQAEAASANELSTSPDGRYAYFAAGGGAGGEAGNSVAGLPAGVDNVSEVFRYDSAENVVQCVSCASPFDPEPKLRALFGLNQAGSTQNGVPGNTIASADGDYAFFDTPAALLPSDVDGEVPPGATGHSLLTQEYTPSSDVYEWRGPGIDGCSHPQGCLSLITSGRGGYLNALLGTTGSGRDVFFYTKESLRPADNDTAGDVYDARIGGGYPEPARPVECEGDACSTPVPAPNDATPGSSTFHGAGNEHPKAPSKGKKHPKHHKKHKKHKLTANVNRRASR